MQRILSVRITKWYFKLLYIAAVWLLGFAIITLFAALNAPAIIGALVNSCAVLAGILLGARIFRGSGESLAVRPWWKMTARPRLSWVLGVMFAVFIVGEIITFATAALGVEISVASLRRHPIDVVILNDVEFALIAFLYLNSAVRMRNLPTPPREPTFRMQAGLR